MLNQIVEYQVYHLQESASTLADTSSNKIELISFSFVVIIVLEKLVVNRVENDNLTKFCVKVPSLFLKESETISFRCHLYFTESFKIEFSVLSLVCRYHFYTESHISPYLQDLSTYWKLLVAKGD